MIQRDIRPHGISPFLSFWGGVAEILCGWLANSVELFLRRPGSFGVRYLNGPALVSTVFLALFTRGTLEFVLGLTDRPGGWLHALPALAGVQAEPLKVQFFLLDLYTYAVIVMGLIHLAAQWKTNQAGLRHHTYFSGEPVFMALYSRFPRRMNGIIPAKTVYDPLFCLALSYPVELLDAVLGNWLFFASVAMFIRARVHYGRARAAELDAFDAIKEAEDSMAAIRGMTIGQESGSSPSQSAAATNAPADGAGPEADARSILDAFMSEADVARHPQRSSVARPGD
jgi:hypothetical protein